MKRGKRFVKSALAVVLSCTMVLGTGTWVAGSEMQTEEETIRAFADASALGDPVVSDTQQAVVTDEAKDAAAGTAEPVVTDEPKDAVPAEPVAPDAPEPVVTDVPEPEAEPTAEPEAEPAEGENAPMQLSLEPMMAAAPSEDAPEQMVQSELKGVQFGDIEQADNLIAPNPLARAVYTKYSQIQEVVNQIEVAASQGLPQVEVDVQSYHISEETLSDFAQTLMNSNPQLFYLKSSYGYWSDTVDGVEYVTKLQFDINSSMTLKDGTVVPTATAITQYEAALNECISQIDSSWTNMEKILFLNDYLCLNVQYDTSYQIYDAYHAFVDHTAVCQGYTLAMTALMNELGIPCSYASSSAMNHIWNVVQLGGNWYHVDVTWDDPVKDVPGRVVHKYFLLSDANILLADGKTAHHDWESAYECPDTTYDEALWKPVTSPFVHVENMICGVTDTGIQQYTVTSSNNQDVFSLGSGLYSIDEKLGKWYVFGDQSSAYQQCFSGLGTYGGKLYFNYINGLYELDPNTWEAVKLTEDAALSSNLSNAYLYYMYMKGNTIYYNTGNPSVGIVASNQTYVLSATEPEPESFTVTITSRLKNGGTTSVAEVSQSGSGIYTAGTTVTVTAPEKPGYTFCGWYEKVADGQSYVGTPVATELVYSFETTKNIDLVAVYEANATVQLTVSNSSGYTVNDQVQNAAYTGGFEAGTLVTVTYTGDNFQYWMNDAGKIVSRAKNYTFHLVSPLNLTAATIENADNKAYVQFVSDYAQVISAGTYGATDEIVVPAGPSKVGYSFNMWDQSVDAIQALIQASQKMITVNPVYTQNTAVYNLSVYVDGQPSSELSADGLAGGVTHTITAPQVEGRQFKCWALDAEGSSVLSTNSDYFMQITGDSTIYAVYADASVVVDKKPVIAIVDKYASITGSGDDAVHKVSFVATRSIPEEYTLIEQGVLYSKVSHTEEEFTIGASDIKQYTGSDMSKNGVLTLNIRVDDVNANVSARGYICVKNNKTGNIETIYSGVESASYNSFLN